jgi:putative Ca2+/H+ antiporter (TMEM165/GDT1 family)
MNNKGVGAVFCLISALLMAARYLSAAIFMSGISTWSSEMFQASLEYIGPALPTAAIAALIAGVIFLAVGIIQDRKGS